MNVKSWANGSGIEKKDNIFTQTYLYYSYDCKWNSADKIETKIKQCEHNATFVFSFLWNANFLLLHLCTVFTYLQREHRNRNGIKVERNKRAFFTHPVSLNYGQLFDLKSGLHFYALPDTPVNFCKF